MTDNSQKLKLLFAISIGFSAWNVTAAKLEQAIKTDVATHNSAIKSQKAIDSLQDKTQKMLFEYRSASHQIETLKTYNQYLQDLIQSQETEKISLTEQLTDIEITQREIVPLMLRMMDSLEKFVQLDLPFLTEERQDRINKLKTMMNRADVTHAEKFRRIMEAYQIENDYGNTIEAYRADLVLNNESSSVDFLRLGRVALFFQRFDGSESGYWDKQSKQWQLLSDDYKHSIQQGIRIARKQTAPDLLTLPIPAAEAGQ